MAWQEASAKHSTFVRGERCLHCSGWRCGRCLEGSLCRHLQRPASWHESVFLDFQIQGGQRSTKPILCKHKKLGSHGLTRSAACISCSACPAVPLWSSNAVKPMHTWKSLL